MRSNDSNEFSDITELPGLYSDEPRRWWWESSCCWTAFVKSCSFDGSLVAVQTLRAIGRLCPLALDIGRTEGSGVLVDGFRPPHHGYQAQRWNRKQAVNTPHD